LGWNGFWEQHYERIGRKTFDQFKMMQAVSNTFFVEDMKICEARGMPIFLGVAVDSVLMAFSLCRTLTDFTRDLYDVPDKVEAAMNAACDDLISNAIEVCRNNRKDVAFIVLERGSGFYYRLEVFERFEWPFLRRYVDAFVSEGITPWLHLDTDWGMNLPYFTQLPKKTCVCDLDGTTDIFRAKEILKGHMCISGDVPAGLLSVGRPDEVREYCRRLMDEVGEGGGFMLTTGCECPIDAKRENLLAMIETGKTYQGKGRGERPTRSAVGPRQEVRRSELKGELAQAVAQLRFDDVLEKVEQGLKCGVPPLEILTDCREGMDRVGELYSSGEYFLSELMMSANIFKKVAAKIEPLLLGKDRGTPLGALVIATPKGDIHDIGKDIVATVLRAAGFDVHDLGVNVPPETIVEAVAKTGARVVAMSALITPTFQSMKRVVDLMKEKGLREGRFVIIGGGPTTPTVRDYVGADAWSLDPKEGADWCKAFVT
jgi:methylmalonyl-CoA mutase cobalamin-binding domain/chain